MYSRVRSGCSMFTCMPDSDPLVRDDLQPERLQVIAGVGAHDIAGQRPQLRAELAGGRAGITRARSEDSDEVALEDLHPGALPAPGDVGAEVRTGRAPTDSGMRHTRLQPAPNAALTSRSRRVPIRPPRTGRGRGCGRVGMALAARQCGWRWGAARAAVPGGGLPRRAARPWLGVDVDGAHPLAEGERGARGERPHADRQHVRDAEAGQADAGEPDDHPLRALDQADVRVQAESLGAGLDVGHAQAARQAEQARPRRAGGRCA